MRNMHETGKKESRHAGLRKGDIMMQKVVLGVIWLLAAGICLLFAASAVADVLFERRVEEERKILLAGMPETMAVVGMEDLKDLPDPVRQWLAQSGVVDARRARSAILKQSGEMRLEKDKAWMPYRAEQVFTTYDPGFIWKVRVKAAPGVTITGRDKYEDGRGSMKIKILSLFTVADAQGPEIDQGTLLRYLAETVWIPSAALSEYIRWEPLGDKSARAVMTCGGVEASGVFEFNEAGEVSRFTAMRYAEKDGSYSLQEWVVTLDAHEWMDGFKIPGQAVVTWNYKEGPFEWDRLTVEEAHYDRGL